MIDVCVGRQPIFDWNRRVAGWELLFRNAEGVRGDLIDGNRATAQTLINSIVEIGLENVAPKGEPVYLNCTREFLDKEPVLPPDRCVLEVLEDIPMDAGLLQAIDALRAQGYRIALDDFVYTPGLAPLVERADIVKFDVMALGLPELAEQVRAVAPFGVCLLAEKIGSERELADCHRMGFELFQGYYLRRPDTLRAKSAKANKFAVLALLGECNREDADLDKIAGILGSDPGLSFKMLQLANSAFFQIRSPVASVRQAIALIGLDPVARWSTLLLLSGFDDCPRSYLKRALERGRMCELLAPHAGVHAQSAYLVGLLSILEAAMETPFSELAPRLPVTNDIKEALTVHAGALGRLLGAVIAYESGEPGDASIAPARLDRCFWSACGYAREVALRLGLDEAPDA